MSSWWSDNIRIFLTVVLSIAFLLLFGRNNIERYLEGAIGKTSDEEFIKQENIPVPGELFFQDCVRLILTLRGTQSPHYILIVITIADTSNLVEKKKVCHRDPDLESCIEKDQRKILKTDPSNHSFYVDYFRRVIQN